MSDPLFDGPGGRTRVALPFDPDELIGDWGRLRAAMAREVAAVPEPFARPEWAYLMTFLDPASLRGFFAAAFGAPTGAAGPVARVARPRSPIAVWLPNNVSLLGPLMLVALSLTGARLLLKAGSRSEDLTGAWLDFARRHLPTGALAKHLTERVEHRVHGADDPRNAELAERASLRIAFGADEAITAIDALPHPATSSAIAFADRRSEAWLHRDAVDDATCDELIRVFSVYGQAGCTSPSRVVLLDAAPGDACELVARLLALWPKSAPGDPAPHRASESVMAAQWGRALGWQCETAPRHAATLMVGDAALPRVASDAVLPIVPASLDEAVASLPERIQTLGVAVPPGAVDWSAIAARSGVKRIVPLGRMHHFGPVWDGIPWFRQCFDEVELPR